MTHLALRTKDGMDKDVLIYNVLLIHTSMDHNAFVLINSLYANIGNTMMGLGVFSIRINAHKEPIGMVLFVNLI